MQHTRWVVISVLAVWMAACERSAPTGSGAHRYFFKLYALDCELRISPASATKSAVVLAMRGHLLGEAELVGYYERK